MYRAKTNRQFFYRHQIMSYPALDRLYPIPNPCDTYEAYCRWAHTDLVRISTQELERERRRLTRRLDEDPRPHWWLYDRQQAIEQALAERSSEVSNRPDDSAATREPEEESPNEQCHPRENLPAPVSTRWRRGLRDQAVIRHPTLHEQAVCAGKKAAWH